MEQEVQTTKTKAKAKGAIDVLVATATEVEKLTKTRALDLAKTLSNGIETDYLLLGGVLKVIKENAWFDGFSDFETFVLENYGFKNRKAMYLIEIYDNLVTKQIPWEKVAPLGWTKLKDLARHLTVDNVDEWVEKALNLSVSELQQMLKAPAASGDSTKTTSTTQVLKFNLVNDQIETVKAAIAKAKAEMGTEYDNVALEALCSGYLSGSVGVAPSLEDILKKYEPEEVLNIISNLHPQIDISVTM